MFKIILTPSSLRFLKKCDKELNDRIYVKLNELSSDPFPADSKRIVGREDRIFRVRVGDYRILYAVYYEKNEIVVADIDKRSRVY
jgi:mRNA interferase RelE/StbE